MEMEIALSPIKLDFKWDSYYFPPRIELPVLGKAAG